MTIHEITNKLNFTVPANSNNRLQLLVVVNAVVDDINLESSDVPLISIRCGKCKKIILNGNDSCMNLECPFGCGMKRPMNIINLNMLVNLKDDTGYLVGCRLRDSTAEQAIGCTVDVLKEMTNEQRLELKGKYYKKFCNVRMQILGPTTIFQKPIYNIFDINKIDCDDNYHELLSLNHLNRSYINN